jgi:hypothetical protein
MVVERKQSTIQRPAYECKSHLRGRSSFITILSIMTHIKNFVSANCVMVSTSKVAVLTLTEEGGES